MSVSSRSRVRGRGPAGEGSAAAGAGASGYRPGRSAALPQRPAGSLDSVRDDLWTLVRFLHVLGACAWVGGMIAIGAVAVPAARAAGDRAAGRRVMTSAGRRFGVLGLVAWVVILVTGFGLLDHRGLSLGDLGDSDYGRRLLVKILLLLAMGVVTVVHALWQGPRARRLEEAGDLVAARRWRLLGAVFDGFLLLAALTTLWLAVSLVP